MNILITGSGGFLGNNLIKKLRTETNQIIGLSKEGLEREVENSPDISIRGDVRDTDFIKRIIHKYKIEEVYHLAGISTVSNCSRDPLSAFEINVLGTVSLLEACRLSGKNIKSIVLSSSDKIFEGSKAPHNEETKVSPRDVYGSSMACRDLAALSYFRNFDMPVKIVVCSNIYGPGDDNLRIIPGTIQKVLRGGKASLYQQAKDYVREFVYVDDAVNAFVLVARRGIAGEMYCCGGTEQVTLRELLDRISSLMGKMPEESVELINKKDFRKEELSQYINSSKLRSLGWAPRVSLDSGIKKTIDFYRRNSKV